MLIKLKKSKIGNSSDDKTVFLGIGTNKGNREKNIEVAIKLLNEDKNIELVNVSRMLRNPPQEGIKSGYFFNGVIKLKTTLNPYELLKLCKRIEYKLGRKQKPVVSGQWSVREKKSRTIDLDILFYENKIIKTPKLTIPHPMLHKRHFVLVPFIEIEKNFVHPVYKKSISRLHAELNKNQRQTA